MGGGEKNGKSSHAEISWCLNELTEGVVTIEVDGGLNEDSEYTGLIAVYETSSQTQEETR